jgi:signal transduction histidine kinase
VSHNPGMTASGMRAVVVAALAAGGGVIALVLTSHHVETKPVWAVFQPAVGWIFIGTGLYAWRRRPESRTGALMVAMGFAWLLAALEVSNSPLVYTVGLVTGGLFGAVFLHLGMSFPTGWLEPGINRRLVIAGYLIFPLAFVPALFFAGPHELRCDDCPTNLLLIERDATLAAIARAFGAFLYASLFVVVLVRAVLRWRRSEGFERLQLTPVYVNALAAFLAVTAAQASGAEIARGVAVVTAALLPFTFLGSLLRTHVSHLDAELRESLEELRASRARIVHAGDAERRRLERDLHDGAQSRLVALALLLRSARTRAKDDQELAAMLDRAQDELQTSLGELRELARGIHPAVLTDRGLEPALDALVARAPVPVTLELEGDDERLPGAVESAAYFVVSEALANVAKYAQATHATVAVRRMNGRVTVEVADDGVGGADAAGGSGLRGLADRVASLDGTLSLDSPAGRGTRLHADIPLPRA